MIFKNGKLYDILKWVSLTALDALGLLYSTVAAIWGLPFGDEVLKTCAALSLCIGTLIGVSSIRYKSMIDGAKEGKITVLNVIDKDEDGDGE